MSNSYGNNTQSLTPNNITARLGNENSEKKSSSPSIVQGS